MPENYELHLVALSDLESEDLRNREYDLALFASGYETRCTFVASQFEQLNAERIVVLGFANEEGNLDRRDNHDNWWRMSRGTEPEVLSPDDPTQIYELLNRHLPLSLDTPRVLVDYSSMSRVWYSAVMTWARFAERASVEIDFVYAPGAYQLEAQGGEYPALVVRGMETVPGFDGLIEQDKEDAAICSLGLDWWQPWAVMENMAPDRALAVWGVHNDAVAERAASVNEDFLKSYVAAEDRYPVRLASVANTYRLLAELSAGMLTRWNVAFVGMGPKPIGLAGLLVGCELPAVSCIRVHGAPPSSHDVQPDGTIIATHVEFGPARPDRRA